MLLVLWRVRFFFVCTLFWVLNWTNWGSTTCLVAALPLPSAASPVLVLLFVFLHLVWFVAYVPESGLRLYSVLLLLWCWKVLLRISPDWLHLVC